VADKSLPDILQQNYKIWFGKEGQATKLVKVAYAYYLKLISSVAILANPRPPLI
jgi:hypothetical protein